ncbi:hypothetical protein V496_01880 [Pseudogymnoascus sp. VKM F-4515 (FW-2607)]|nr:hypothetical protein V496_01880 [Pseudogymnoascus sp. VKM F-4515 (FW-2607)]
MALSNLCFSGQNWKGTGFYPDGSSRRRLLDACVEATNWDALCLYASTLNNSIKCRILPDITNGQFHLVRLLEFENQSRWIARIQLRKSTELLAKKLQREVDAMAIVRERTNIPVPQVFGYETNDSNQVGVAFILMEFLPGNVAMDADGGYETHNGEIPPQHKTNFYDEVARIQVEMTSVRLPRIGTIIKCTDGSYDIGPFPDLGGPFDTATAFFEAWAAKAKFPKSRGIIQKSMKTGPVNEVLASITEFPRRIKALASRLSSCDNGPFPVWHPDFLHSNIIVDEGYRVLGVIDWEGTCTIPWGLVEFPLFLETVPFPMDASWNYDENGQPLYEDTKRRWQERKEYVEKVAGAEASKQIDNMLSASLDNHDVQNLAYALRVYLDPGKLGFYDKVLESFESKYVR